ELRIIASVPPNHIVREAKPNVSHVIARHRTDDARPLAEGFVLSAPLAIAEAVSSANRRSDPWNVVAIKRKRYNGRYFLLGVRQRCKSRSGSSPKFEGIAARRPDRSMAVA